MGRTDEGKSRRTAPPQSDTVHPFSGETQRKQDYSPPQFATALVSLSIESLGRHNEQQKSEPIFYTFLLRAVESKHNLV